MLLSSPIINRELYQLAHHPCPFPNVLLHQLAADHTNEARVRAVRDSACGQGLPGARRAVQQDSLRGVDPEGDKALGVQQGELHYLNERCSVRVLCK